MAKDLDTGDPIDGSRHRGAAVSTSLAVGLTLLVLAVGCSGPPSEGQRLFEKRCSRCHTVETPLGKRKDREGWKRTVWAMRKRGAELTDAEAQKVVDYLVRVRGK